MVLIIESKFRLFPVIIQDRIYENMPLKIFETFFFVIIYLKINFDSFLIMAVEQTFAIWTFIFGI